MNRTNSRQRRAARPARIQRIQKRPAQPFSRQPRRHTSAWHNMKSLLALGVLAAAILWAVAYGQLETRIQYNGEDSQQLQAIAERYFAETSRLRFTFDEVSLQRYIERQAPFLEDVSVNLPLFSRRVHVTAQTPPPALIWQSEGVRYALSDSGYVLDTAIPADDTSLPVVFDQANLTYQAGQKLVPESFVAFTSQLTELLKREEENGFTVESIAIEESSHSLTLATADYKIYLSTDIQPSAQVVTITDLLTSLREQGRAAPASYIDARVPGRVFWQ